MNLLRLAGRYQSKTTKSQFPVAIHHHRINQVDFISTWSIRGCIRLQCDIDFRRVRVPEVVQPAFLFVDGIRLSIFRSTGLRANFGVGMNFNNELRHKTPHAIFSSCQEHTALASITFLRNGTTLPAEISASPRPAARRMAIWRYQTVLVKDSRALSHPSA